MAGSSPNGQKKEKLNTLVLLTRKHQGLFGKGLNISINFMFVSALMLCFLAFSHKFLSKPLVTFLTSTRGERLKTCCIESLPQPGIHHEHQVTNSIF